MIARTVLKKVSFATSTTTPENRVPALQKSINSLGCIVAGADFGWPRPCASGFVIPPNPVPANYEVAAPPNAPG